MSGGSNQGTELTSTEYRILSYASIGLRDRHIAILTGRSHHTVAMGMRRILSKLDARNRTQAVAIAIRQGLLS